MKGYACRYSLQQKYKYNRTSLHKPLYLVKYHMVIGRDILNIIISQDINYKEKLAQNFFQTLPSIILGEQPQIDIRVYTTYKVVVNIFSNQFLHTLIQICI